jgi:hypothetical protein
VSAEAIYIFILYEIISKLIIDIFNKYEKPSISKYFIICRFNFDFLLENVIFLLYKKLNIDDVIKPNVMEVLFDTPNFKIINNETL